MNKNLIALGGLAACFLMAGNISAQSRDRDRVNDDEYRYEDRYHQAPRNDNWWRGRVFQRIRTDLDHIQAVTPRFSPDQYKLARTKEELNELQTKLEQGRYDQPELDRVIGGLSRLANDSNLAERDRQMLSDDLNKMWQFREHHDDYGARTTG